jgi:carbonic anhydrase
MDFRLDSAVHDFIVSQNLENDIDVISVAGSAKDIAQIENGFVENQVDLSCRLHQTTTVILMNHTDCGGYGGQAVFESDEAERAQHTKDLRVAREKILARHPQVSIRLTLAILGEDGSISIEEIPSE